MANQVPIGNNSILLIKIPARGTTDWAADFKSDFADVISEHDHTTGRGARIKNAALVTNTMVASGEGVTKVDGTFTAYTSADVAVSTDTIQDLAVTRAKIANDAIDGTKIADNSITADHIVDGTIITADVADDAITTAKILDANVTTAKIADGAVTLDKLSNTIVITEDTTITADTYNTHFILNDATGSVTLTFSDCKVEGCQFTSSAAIAGYVVLDGIVDFFRNTLHETHLNLTDIDLSDFNISYNSMTGGSIVGNPNINNLLTQDQTNAGSFFRYNFLNVYSINVRMPLGYFAGNTITAKNTSTLYLYAEDTINNFFHNTYSVSGNIITFVSSGDFKKTSTIDNISKSAFQLIYTGSTLTQTALHPSLSDIQDVSSTAPTAGQVLKWDGSEWSPATDQAGSGGGSITTIASQSDATSYTPSEGDTLKITADVTFDNLTFNKIKMYVAETNTLTFNRGTIDNCEILGGNVTFKAQSTQTMTLKNSKISACDTVAIKQDKVDSDEVVTITVKNVDIVCKQYSYYMTYQNLSDLSFPSDRSTTSNFTNVSVNFSVIGAIGDAATANFSNCRFIGATTTSSSLTSYYLISATMYIGEDLFSNSSHELGTISNNNLTIGTDSGGLFVRVGQAAITSFS